MVETSIVLVLGDVGRSPRMQYHALSLARTASMRRVFLVGYGGERVFPAVQAEPKITQVLLTADLLPRPRARPLYLLYAPCKAVLQLGQLLWTLLVSLPRVDVLLLQTPLQLKILLLCRGHGFKAGGPRYRSRSAPTSPQTLIPTRSFRAVCW